MTEGNENVIVRCHKCGQQPIDFRTGKAKPLTAVLAARWKETHEKRYPMVTRIAVTFGGRGRLGKQVEQITDEPTHRVAVDVVL